MQLRFHQAKLIERVRNIGFQEKGEISPQKEDM
jgi:hypothetical protein